MVIHAPHVYANIAYTYTDIDFCRWAFFKRTEDGYVICVTLQLWLTFDPNEVKGHTDKRVNRKAG